MTWPLEIHRRIETTCAVGDQPALADAHVFRHLRSSKSRRNGNITDSTPNASVKLRPEEWVEAT
jgi:hypothetical protein